MARGNIQHRTPNIQHPIGGGSEMGGRGGREQGVRDGANIQHPIMGRGEEGGPEEGAKV